ncbi:hypothetical protein DFH09DRAFT_377198 [Mycena vulgaris]|nr:hypothetical protein DFH09DRAFT_377198 [Mycena vulgaris]
MASAVRAPRIVCQVLPPAATNASGPCSASSGPAGCRLSPISNLPSSSRTSSAPSAHSRRVLITGFRLTPPLCSIASLPKPADCPSSSFCRTDARRIIGASVPPAARPPRPSSLWRRCAHILPSNEHGRGMRKLLAVPTPDESSMPRARSSLSSSPLLQRAHLPLSDERGRGVLALPVFRRHPVATGTSTSCRSSVPGRPRCPCSDRQSSPASPHTPRAITPVVLRGSPPRRARAYSGGLEYTEYTRGGRSALRALASRSDRTTRRPRP